MKNYKTNCWTKGAVSSSLSQFSWFIQFISNKPCLQSWETWLRSGQDLLFSKILVHSSNLGNSKLDFHCIQKRKNYLVLSYKQIIYKSWPIWF